jgi:hypothetical protein
MRWRVPVEISRDELEALVERSTVVSEREKHRLIYEGDWKRWGSRGGKETLRRYGPRWFRAAGPQEVGVHRPGGARGREGDPMRLVARGVLEVRGPNVASKRPRIAFKARRVR